MRIKANIGPGTYTLISGGSSGIGLALAQDLVRAGGNVYLVARRIELLDQAVAALSNLKQLPDQRIAAFPVDVSDWRQVQALAEQMMQGGVTPDILINSAGIVEPGYVQDLKIEHFHQMMDINYQGTVHVIKAFLPEMMRRKSGYIINVSSGGGLTGIFGYTGYCASKFAVRGFSEALRYELAPYKIGVVVVYPPDTETPQLEYDILHKPPETKALTETAGRMTAPAVARIILRDAQKGKPVILPGFEAGLLHFLSTNFGGKLLDWMSRIILFRSAKSKKQ